MKSLSLSGLAIIAAVALTGCGGTHDQAASGTAAPPAAPAIVQPGAPGQASAVVASVPTYHDNNFTDGDVKFMQGMIHHHNQALQMAAMIPTHTKTPELGAMGTKIQ